MEQRKQALCGHENYWLWIAVNLLDVKIINLFFQNPSLYELGNTSTCSKAISFLTWLTFFSTKIEIGLFFIEINNQFIYLIQCRFQESLISSAITSCEGRFSISSSGSSFSQKISRISCFFCSNHHKNRHKLLSFFLFFPCFSMQKFSKFWTDLKILA